ncbi:acid phosphatase protein [Rutstroemia sp. NJR-2017a BBW]|nr:acid phosphatase protein [Rutstroemia sp. NJR-2017a BBW]
MAHISGVAAFFIIILFVAVAGAIIWVVYTHLRARRLGLPQPTLSSYNPFGGGGNRYGGSGGQGGMVGWVKDKVNGFKNRNNRSAGGAYEEPLSSNVRGRGANRGFGPLDPDEAWDARVGTEADAYGPGGYYEEQELGLHGGHQSGGAGGAGPSGFGSPSRGRSLSREPEPYIGGSQAGLDRRYDEEMGVRPKANPFDDPTELRGVSPRPIETSGKAHKVKDSVDDSPSERRSMFRENM